MAKMKYHSLKPRLPADAVLFFGGLSKPKNERNLSTKLASGSFLSLDAIYFSSNPKPFVMVFASRRR
jgi:hypothetical protein